MTEPVIIDGQYRTIDEPTPTPKPRLAETARARQAYNDYLGMGPGRTLAGLLRSYEERLKVVGKRGVPTLRKGTLELWSRQYGWQQRIAEAVIRDTETIARAREEALQREVTSGIADQTERLRELKGVYGIVRAGLGESVDGMSSRMIETLVTQIRGLLDDVAREVGARSQTVKITQTQVKLIVNQLSAQTGVPAEQLLAEARQLVEAALEDR